MSCDLPLPEAAGLQRGARMSAIGWIGWDCEPGERGAASGVRVHFAVPGLSLAQRTSDRAANRDSRCLGVAGDHEQQLQSAIRPGVCRSNETGLCHTDASNRSANAGEIASSPDWQTTEAIVYELFVTSQSVGSLSALDIISLYRGRGGFEGSGLDVWK